MTALAGVLAFDGRPGAWLLASLPPFPAPPGGWDASGDWSGPAGLAVRWAHRATTPEAIHETFPVQRGASRFDVFFAGRLDNRDELLVRYGGVAAGPDGALMAAALECDGPDAVRHAVGDFVCVAWDRLEDLLWLARDAMGHRPLYLVPTPEACVFSTDIGGILRGPARDRAWRTEALVEYLCGELILDTSAVVDGVIGILPGTLVSIRRGTGAIVQRAYWTPPAVVPAREATADLVDEFRARLETAVRACLRAPRPPAVQLSGGLDSSAVAVTAAAAADAPIDTVSLVFPGLPRDRAGEIVDESPWIDAVVTATGARSLRWDPRQVTAADIWRLTSRHGLPPDAPNGDPLQWRLGTLAASAGHRVLLTGVGGDHFLTGSLARLPALLARGEWRDAWRFAHEARAALGVPVSALVERVLAWCAPERIKDVWRSRRAGVPPWLTGAAARAVVSGRRAAEAGLRRALADVPDLVLRDMHAVLGYRDAAIARESLTRTGDDAGVEFRHPFADRRLVEFAMTLPDEWRLRDGRTRYILRRALAGRWPDVVATRTSKGDGDVNSLVQLHLLLAGPPALTRPDHLAARGLVRPEAVARAWQRVIDEGDRHVPSAADRELFLAAALERFLGAAGRA